MLAELDDAGEKFGGCDYLNVFRTRYRERSREPVNRNSAPKRGVRNYDHEDHDYESDHEERGGGPRDSLNATRDYPSFRLEGDTD